ncbi:MAG TPA: hypothetical protein PLP17_12040, partial [Oligoflexia bacterium]|nr:hypothetical protein [Oligoflexia bacterium]
MNVFRTFRILAVLIAAAVTTLPALVCAQHDPVFRARVAVRLCGEYRLGGVSLEVKYAIGASSDLISPPVLQETIDAQAGEAVVEIELPATYASTPINVFAFCSDHRGISKASNALTVSNCDVLALLDSDADGLYDNEEDTDCNGFFNPGDASNAFNVDTDGDGVRDQVEKLAQTSPTNPASSPRPYIYSGGVFDPDRDGSANAVVFRSSAGTWYIRDFVNPGYHLAIPFGKKGDVPFTYRSEEGLADLGVIRQSGNNLLWMFRGPGFSRAGASTEIIQFGIFGDNIILGPWEKPGVTNPAVARLFNNRWTFDIYLSDGSVRSQDWGGNFDIPKPADYDGDVLFDIAVFRPAEQKTYIIHSRDRSVAIYNFGSGTADHTVRGDYTGDDIDDITVWEPASGMFSTMTSDNSFADDLARARTPGYYEELQLGLYFVHLPLNWNSRQGRLLYTVVDHAA